VSVTTCSKFTELRLRQGLKGEPGEKGRSVFLDEHGVTAGLIEGPPGPRGAIGLPGEKVCSTANFAPTLHYQSLYSLARR